MPSPLWPDHSVQQLMSARGGWSEGCLTLEGGGLKFPIEEHAQTAKNMPLLHQEWDLELNLNQMQSPRCASGWSCGWVGCILADWVSAGQTGPSSTKEMHHVSFQGFPEVSRQMGMEMSRQRAHFNLARHSWSSHYTRLFTCKHTRTHKDAHIRVQTNTPLPDERKRSISHSFIHFFNNSHYLTTHKPLVPDTHSTGLHQVWG